ncbi:hypothetical protein X777_01935, partial [Ooceraea biroi]
MASYTYEEYYDMLMALGECNGQHNVAARRYIELYPNRPRHPSARVILGAAQRLYETGNILPNKHDTGRDRCARNLRNTETVVCAVEQNPETTYSTVQRILKEEKLHAFHYTRVQHLQPEDYPLRRRFCEDFYKKNRTRSHIPVLGVFNSHNMHLWSRGKNPWRVHESRNFQTRWKMNVWSGIFGTEILGPIILPDILNCRNISG